MTDDDRARRKLPLQRPEPERPPFPPARDLVEHAIPALADERAGEYRAVRAVLAELIAAEAEDPAFVADPLGYVRARAGTHPGATSDELLAAVRAARGQFAPR